jgi:8-oxo-dGTP diphosphatase
MMLVSVPPRPTDLVAELPRSAKVILVAGSAALLVRKVNGVWDLPGGRLDPGEDLLQGLDREVREELGVPLPGPVALADSWIKPRPGRPDLHVHFFSCRFETRERLGRIRLSAEHDQARWTLLAQLPGMPMPPAYLTAVESVLSLRA